jgi:dynein heavy chain
LIELKAFVHKSETETILDLEKQLMAARYRLEFLLDHCTLSPAEIRSNTLTFSWYDRLPQIFDEHKTIVADKTLQFQEALKVHLV